MNFKTIKTKLPWWFKVLSKMVIYRLPLPYQFWQSISLFDDGKMEVPDYAYNVFSRHFKQVSQHKPLPEKFVSLELGPGDSLFSALISHSFGGGKTYLVDAGDYTIQELEPYKQMGDFLKQRNLPLPAGIDEADSVSEIMEICNADYLQSGLASLKSIESNSVDFIWSQAVLEHVKRSEFLDIMKELRRIVRDDGVCSHLVDLRDHIDCSLNNLRFSEKIWESKYMTNSGFYTNRIQYSLMLDMFKEAGFAIKSTEVDKWESLPIKRSELDKQFASFTDEDLRVSGFSVILQPA
ncbi:MAG: methyltransferase domain-containing protein [Waterburya sp.]